MSAPRAKPLKRPSQARARFTVQAIYDAFVRIWQTQGWARLTTRAVALETGISVGTLYEYFPSKQALLSGYGRHCIDALLDAIDKQVVQASDLPWPDRVHRLLRLTCGIDQGGCFETSKPTTHADPIYVVDGVVWIEDSSSAPSIEVRALGRGARLHAIPRSMHTNGRGLQSLNHWSNA